MLAANDRIYSSKYEQMCKYMIHTSREHHGIENVYSHSRVLDPLPKHWNMTQATLLHIVRLLIISVLVFDSTEAPCEKLVPKRILVGKLKISPPGMFGYLCVGTDDCKDSVGILEVALALQIFRIIQVDFEWANSNGKSYVGAKAGPEIPILYKMNERNRGWQLQLPILIGYRYAYSASPDDTGAIDGWWGHYVTFEVEFDATYWLYRCFGISIRIFSGGMILKKSHIYVERNGIRQYDRDWSGTIGSLRIGLSTGLAF
jgi:hypothetical protein